MSFTHRLGVLAFGGIGLLLLAVYFYPQTVPTVQSVTDSTQQTTPIAENMAIESVPTTSTNTPAVFNDSKTTPILSPAEIAQWYGENLIPIKIGTESRLASVADTVTKRQLGLSNTPALPDTIVKLFVFETSSTWGFWMKDMNYAIDIIWVDADKKVVYVAPLVSPATYPTLFKPPVPALYVIETVSGFARTFGIEIGSEVVF